MSRRGGLAALVLLFASTAHAQTPASINADRPGLADAAAVVGKATLQIESGLQWEHHEGEDTAFFPTLFRVGLTRRLEARVEGNTLSTTLGAARQTGLAPISLGAKLAIVLAEDGKPGVSVIGRVIPKWGTNGFQSDHTAGDVRMAVDWDIAARWSLNPNVGLAWSDGEEKAFATGMVACTLGYAPRPAIYWFIDASLQQNEVAGGTASAVWDGGLAYLRAQNWQFDVSAGARAHGRTAARFFVAIGFAYRHRPGARG